MVAVRCGRKPAPPMNDLAALNIFYCRSNNDLRPTRLNRFGSRGIDPHPHLERIRQGNPV